MNTQNKNGKGTLYVVGVPIGNYGDLSPRALNVLRNVDIIAAEDPRVTVKLLDYFGIKKPMVLYGDFKDNPDGESPMEILLRGGDCALVSDAGMPVISDPGIEFISLCRQMSVPVTSVPGPCAISSALSLCSLNVSRFVFEGFLTVNRANRLSRLNEIKDEKRAMVFYESPKKLSATLADLYRTFGLRRCAVIRDLTKPTENCIVSDLETASKSYENARLKGEFVIIIEAV